MEIKIFGKSLFSFSGKKGNLAVEQARQAILSDADLKSPESKFLPDFQKFSAGRDSSPYAFVEVTSVSGVAYPTGEVKKETKRKDSGQQLTPKGVYQMELLHKKAFKMNTNADYIEKQLADFTEKLNLLNSEEWDVRRGIDEVKSVVLRLENRKKYPEVKEFFEQFPYTTGTRIDQVTKAHDYLKLGQVGEFLADMPKEATQIMKEYNAATKKVCDKQAVFYIVANKKDFERTQKRRDPILLAQSPFGHFWQILGAWDEEMLLLEEL